MKRLIWIAVGALLLSALFGIMMASCGGSGTDETTASVEQTTTTTPDKYPVPTESYKIGVVVFGNADLETQGAIEYLKENIGPKFNVEFVVSEDIDDADAELTFLENCAASGCKGILAYQTLTPKAAPDKCKELGMYYVKGSKPLDEMEFGWAKGNTYYVGAACPIGDYQLGYDCLTQFLSEGARKIGMATGGAESGNAQHLPRTQGAEAAIADFEKANPGVEIEVTQFGGFSGDAFSASQAQMIAGNPDAIFATFAVEDLWVQPLTDAGKAGVIRLGGVSSINPVSVTAMQDGTLNWWGGKYCGYGRHTLRHALQLDDGLLCRFQRQR